jgi:hypothetical protein
MSKLTRRQLMAAAVGASQLALLDAMTPSKAHAQTAGPTRFVTIYVKGGWYPSFLWCPYGSSGSTSEVSRQITGLARPDLLESFAGEPAYFTPSQVVALGSGQPFEPAPGAVRMPIRVGRQWNPANIADRANGYSPLGSSWSTHKLHENTLVLHGIDQGTAAHDSGIISSLSGAAGSEYRAPSMHAVIAQALSTRFTTTQRPLPVVALRSGLRPSPFELPAQYGSSVIDDLDSLIDTLSKRKDRTWAGLRQTATRSVPPFRPGGAATDIELSPIDDFVLRETALMRGQSTAGTDTYLEGIYESTKSVSQTLARDVLTILSNPAYGLNVPAGTANADRPFAIASTIVDYGIDHYEPQFDMALRLLQSGLATSISIEAPGVGGFAQFGFDTHGEAFGAHMVHLRGTYEIIGRFLGLMKAKGLFSDTLVMIHSEFSRTTHNDHWPYTSVALVGAGIQTDAMVGNYDVVGRPALHDPTGLPVSIREETGSLGLRPPKSADVCTTVYDIFGAKSFIPGGYGVIQGVKA